MQHDTERDRWHLDKKVPISIILVLMAQGAAGLWAVADIKKDVEVLKAAQLEQQRRDERQDRQQSDSLGIVRGDIQALSQKLDRLIEKQK